MIDLLYMENPGSAYSAAHAAPARPTQLEDEDGPDAYTHALSIVAHDLRGPLANLAILIENIAENAAGEALPRIARDARRADATLQQLNKLLGALLQRARQGRDPLSCNRSTFQLLPVLELAIAVNRPLARRRAIGFDCHASEALPLSGDQELLFEAFDNLISNAVKHTRDGGTVRCETGPAEDGGLYIRIADEGSGFTATDLARAFRPFTSLTPCAGTDMPSHGLGLWITRLIIERHGGRLNAHNRADGKGAVLTIWLPTLGAPKAMPRSHPLHA